MEKTHIVTAFLRFEGKVLVLKRSSSVGTYRGLWSGVSGYLEKEDRKPRDRALTEIKEETGIKNLKLVKEIDPVFVRDKKMGYWVVHPFLFDVDTPKVKLDWENKKYRWIRPENIKDYDTVPGLDIVLGKLMED